MKPKHKKTLDNVEVGKSIEINGYDYDSKQKKPHVVHSWDEFCPNIRLYICK